MRSHPGIRALTLLVLLVVAPVTARAQSEDVGQLRARMSEHFLAGRYDDALRIAEQTLKLTEDRDGPKHAETGRSLYFLGVVYTQLGRYADAERSITRSAAILRDTAELGNVFGALAQTYIHQGRFAEAEHAAKRSIGAFDSSSAPDPSALAKALNSLAVVYDHQGRSSEAVPIVSRVLALVEKELGTDHPTVNAAVNNLAYLNHRLGRLEEAEALYRRALSALEKRLGNEHESVATALSNLAVLLDDLQRYDESLAQSQRALAIVEKSVGPYHQMVGLVLNNIAGTLQTQRRYRESEAYYERAIAVYERAVGKDHHAYATAVLNLASLHMNEQDWSKAVERSAEGAAVVIARTRRDGQTIGRALTGKVQSGTLRSGETFFNYVKAAYALAGEVPARRAPLAGEMFEMAQWAVGSEAAQSIAQMASRQAAGSDGLAKLVRERQDLLNAWERRDDARISWLTLPREQRNAELENDNARQMHAIDERIAEIDARLQTKFPNYAALANPEPLALAEVQRLLGPDEALVMILATDDWRNLPEASFIWAVTKNESRWVRSDIGVPTLKREVAALRCGLDYEGAWIDGADRCRELTAQDYTNADRRAGKPLPFDVPRAHRLYKSLFGEIEGLIGGKHLIVVPTGPLTQLPFHVLVTRASGETDVANAPSSGYSAHEAARPQESGRAPAQPPVARNATDWLVRRHAITIIPAVSSLNALRSQARESRASKPLIGFGNPLLDGPDKRYATLARAAQGRRHCRGSRWQRVAGLLGLRAVVPLADPDAIRRATPLPETADELCRVAERLGTAGADIHLADRAREARLKELSQSGRLDKYRIVHFATHGAMAGELNPHAEPGLILTPPAEPSDVDDGYLSASEIAALKLDADLVILSACNTAAGGAEGAEALSGLARAFFYAGARALLVSHWYVDSDATVALVTEALSELAADKSLSRAEALRRAMLALIESGGKSAEPASWAPFVLVGEGSAW